MLILTLQDLNAWHGDNLQLDVPNNTDRKYTDSSEIRVSFYILIIVLLVILRMQTRNMM